MGAAEEAGAAGFAMEEEFRVLYLTACARAPARREQRGRFGVL